MNSIEIKSAKIKNTMFLDFSYREKKDIKTDDINQSSDLPFHDDCKHAFLNLLPHFILICEQEKASKRMKDFIYEGVDNPDDELLKSYEVTSFKIGGSGDNEGVTITGKKFLSTGKTLNLNTPFQRFDDEDYKFGAELVEALEELKSEVFQYMTGNKHAPIAQQSMEFDDAFDGEDEDHENEIPKPQDIIRKMKKDGISIEVVR